MPTFIMLIVMYSVCNKEAYTECHYAERRYAECSGAFCPAVGDEDKKVLRHRHQVLPFQRFLKYHLLLKVSPAPKGYQHI